MDRTAPESSLPSVVPAVVRSLSITQFSDHILENLVAPNLPHLTKCGAPDFPSLPHFWGSLFLNRAITPEVWGSAQGILLSTFIARLESAVEDYRAGREQLMVYVSDLPQHDELNAYRRALARFESCILRGHIAFCSLKRLGTLINAASLYENNDGSDYDRIRLINNRIKHFDEDVSEASNASRSYVDY